MQQVFAKNIGEFCKHYQGIEVSKASWASRSSSDTLPDLYSVLGYRRRWLLLSLFSRKRISSTAPIVIGGSERSGTTLLRVLLGRHPEISCGRESTLFLKRVSGPRDIGPRFDLDADLIERWQRESRSQVEFIERFQASLLASEGKSVWAEKTPENVNRFAFVRRHFPNARLIHIIRDGRDVVCSLRRQSWARLRGHHWKSPQALEICADQWASRVLAGRQFAADPLYLELRYEDLVCDPEATLRRVLDFVGLDWSDRLLQPEAAGRDFDEIRARSPVSDCSVGRWRDELSISERELIGERIGYVLVSLGYPADPAWDCAQHGKPAATSRGAVARLWRAWCDPLIRLPKPVRARLADLLVLYSAAKDRRIPWLARAAASMGVAYYLNPIDLIPDNIPVVGYLDDVTVLWIGLRLAAALAPPGVLAELRDAAALSLGLV